MLMPLVLWPGLNNLNGVKIWWDAENFDFYDGTSGVWYDFHLVVWLQDGLQMIFHVGFC